MWVRNKRVDDVAVHSLSVHHIAAGYQEGGPDAQRLRVALRGREDDRAACIRWDPDIADNARFRDILGRVPHFLWRAALSFHYDDVDVSARVAWLGDGVGPASLEQILVLGISDVDLVEMVDAQRRREVYVEPIAYALDTIGASARVSARTVDDVAVEGTSMWRIALGPASHAIAGEDRRVFRGALAHDEERVELATGMALASTRLHGPPLGDHAGETRNGRWRTSLDFQSVVECGREGLADILCSAIAPIEWRAHAREWFDDWDDW